MRPASVPPASDCCAPPGRSPARTRPWWPMVGTRALPPSPHRPRGGLTGVRCVRRAAAGSMLPSRRIGGAGQHPQQLWRQIDTSSALAGPPTGRTPRTKSGAFRPSRGRGLRSSPAYESIQHKVAQTQHVFNLKNPSIVKGKKPRNRPTTISLFSGDYKSQKIYNR